MRADRRAFSFPVSNLTVYDPKYPVPQVQQYNLGVQQRLSRGVVSLEGNKFNSFALARAAGPPRQHGPIHCEGFGRISANKVSGAEVGTSQKR